jgi:hypothetical protein
MRVNQESDSLTNEKSFALDQTYIQTLMSSKPSELQYHDTPEKAQQAKETILELIKWIESKLNNADAWQKEILQLEKTHRELAEKIKELQIEQAKLVTTADHKASVDDSEHGDLHCHETLSPELGPKQDKYYELETEKNKVLLTRQKNRKNIDRFKDIQNNIKLDIIELVNQVRHDISLYDSNKKIKGTYQGQDIIHTLIKKQPSLPVYLAQKLLSEIRESKDNYVIFRVNKAEYNANVLNKILLIQPRLFKYCHTILRNEQIGLLRVIQGFKDNGLSQEFLVGKFQDIDTQFFNKEDLNEYEKLASDLGCKKITPPPSFAATNHRLWSNPTPNGISSIDENRTNKEEIIFKQVELKDAYYLMACSQGHQLLNVSDHEMISQLSLFEEKMKKSALLLKEGTKLSGKRKLDEIKLGSRGPETWHKKKLKDSSLSQEHQAAQSLLKLNP